LLDRFWNRATTRRSDLLVSRLRINAGQDKKADGDQGGSTDALSAVNDNVFPDRKLPSEFRHKVRECCSGRRHTPVRNREREELDAIGLTQLCFVGQA
jgi:hypothetical protein